MPTFPRPPSVPPTDPPEINLDDVAECPVADACEQCNTTVGLAACALQVPYGVLCATLCQLCRRRQLTLTLPVLAALDRAAQHCDHLGIDVDLMRAVLDGETTGTAS